MVVIRVSKFNIKIIGPSDEVMTVQNHLRCLGLSGLINEMNGSIVKGDMVLNLDDGKYIDVHIE